MHPNAARGTVVPIPPMPPVTETMSRGTVVPRQMQQQQQQHKEPEVDFLSSDPPNQQAGNSSATADDLAGLFGNVSVAPAGNATNPATASSNPFDSFVGAPVSSSPVPPSQVQQPPFRDLKGMAHSSHSVHSASSAGGLSQPAQQLQAAQYIAPPPHVHAQPVPQQGTHGVLQFQPQRSGAPSYPPSAGQHPLGGNYGTVPQQQQQPQQFGQQGLPSGYSNPLPGLQQAAPQRPNANPFDPFG
jgi:hypothetical protein